MESPDGVRRARARRGGSGRSPRRGRGVGRTARRVLLAAALGAMGCALVMAADEARLLVKAELAGVLIQRAFADHLRDGAPHRPWRWADMHPVATLAVERLGVRRSILTGASGESLAFGLGHVDGTAVPGSNGNCVVAGHRDTQAAFLARLRRGDHVRVRTVAGERRYVVATTRVVDETAVGVLAPTRSARLTLVTCYPFGAQRGGRERFIVTCVPAPGPERTTPPRG